MKIPLSKSIEAHGRRYSEIELKEPTGGLYVKLGDPRLMVLNPSGSGYFIEQPEIVRAYLEALIVHELGADVIGLLSLDDAMEVKKVLFGFFTDAAARIAERK